MSFSGFAKLASRDGATLLLTRLGLGGVPGSASEVRLSGTTAVEGMASPGSNTKAVNQVREIAITCLITE